MPTPDQILAGLGEVANSWRWLAIVWHVYMVVLAVALAAGVRPSRRVVGILLALPFFSVSALAWRGGNPFNGMAFAVAGVCALLAAGRLGGSRVVTAAPRVVISGAVMLIFGLVYPHFLEDAPFWHYIYEAPTGLIPCPTLSAIVGLGLIVGGLGSWAWSMIVGVIGVFYGLFGALRLGVAMDFVLVLGAISLIQVSITLRSRHARQEEA